MTVKRLPKTPLTIGRMGAFYLILFGALATAAGVVIHLSQSGTSRYTEISTKAIRQLNTLAAIRKEADAAQLSTIRMTFNTEACDVAAEQTTIWELQYVYAGTWQDYNRFISHAANQNDVDSLIFYHDADKKARATLIELAEKGPEANIQAVRYYYEHQKPVYERYGDKISAVTLDVNRRIQQELRDTNAFVKRSSTLIYALLLLSFCIMVAGGLLIARHQRQLGQVQATLARERIERHAEITRQTLGAQERERNELGKELHDNVNQLLSAAKLTLSVAQEQVNEPARPLISRSIECLQQAVDEIRCLCRSLVSPVSSSMALGDAVRDLIAATQPLLPNTALKVNVKMAYEQSLSKELKITIYRIIQEQLGNIIKHSGASEASIELVDSSTSVRLVVADNGAGFDRSKRFKGIGLDNIVNRAQAFHGSVELDTAPGKGCAWSIQFPLHCEKGRSRLHSLFSHAAPAV